MDDYELLLRHAANWARDHTRPIDSALVALALQLRADHDDLPANQWPPGSAEHLMLVRWPSHGPVEPPNVDDLVDSLDTFWGFLRSTGRMSAASAQPAQLRREAKRAAPRMAAACADQHNFGTAKQLLTYGSEIGIDLDDIPDIDEANRRMQQIVEAWNAQPEDERLSRGQQWPVHGRPGGYEPGDGPDPEEFFFDPSGLPDSPLFEFDEAGNLLLPEPLDLAASAAQARASGFMLRILALADWVGDGKPITATDTLRPAVGQQAYLDLKLRDWEREIQGRTQGAPLESDEGRTSDEAPTWRSATECFALERLWRPALLAGLITTSGRRARFEPSAVPTEATGWLHLAIAVTSVSLAGWNDGESLDLAIETLTSIDAEHGDAARPEEIAGDWWDSPANSWHAAVESDVDDEWPNTVNEGLLRDISDGEVAAWLATFADHGIWREQKGRLIGTEFGRDVLIILIAGMSGTNPWEE